MNEYKMALSLTDCRLLLTGLRSILNDEHSIDQSILNSLTERLLDFKKQIVLQKVIYDGGLYE